MLFQKPSYCGPYAIVNACLALGHDHTGQISEIASYAGTTRALGTNEHGVITALQRLGYVATQLAAPSPKNLWSYVTTAVAQGDGVILCVDGEDHWVAVIGTCGGVTGRVVVFDSDNSLKNVAACGVQIYDEAQFRDRLGDSAYAIRVGDGPSEQDSRGQDVETDDDEALSPGSSAGSDDVMSSIQELLLVGGRPEFKTKTAETVLPDQPRMPNKLADYLFGENKKGSR